MPTTIYDVARHAGVSSRTVTNVLNNYKWVSAATRARVEESIAELSYTPSPTARNLRLGRSGLIALAVPELIAAYFAELCEAIIDAASERSYTVVIERTRGNADEERGLLLDPSRSRRFDGLIFSPLGLDPSELHPGPSGTPVVMLGERVHDGEFDHVAIDNVQAARDAVTHLLGLGRTRIAAIGHNATTGAYRTVGYKAALKAGGLPYDRRLVMPTPYYYRDLGSEAMAKLLRRDTLPDAVFCYNDHLAIGATRMILKRGLRIPEDVAIVGFDDVEEGRYSTPSLTTISPNKAEIARLAVDQLLRRIGGDTSPCVSLEAPYELVARESTLGPTATEGLVGGGAPGHALH